MYLFRRGKVWWVEYVAHGERHRETTGHKKKRDAERWVRNLETASQADSFNRAVEILRVIYDHPENNYIPLIDAWGEYERIAKSVGKLNVTPQTLRTRRALLASFVNWTKHHAGTVKTVEAVNGPIAARFAQYLETTGNSSKTRRNKITELSTIWNMLEKVSVNVHNPWPHLAPSVTDGKRIPAFTVEQEEAVLSAARRVGKGWYAACVIARHTGLRYGDVANLTWEEIDLDAGVIRHKPRKTKKFGIVVTLPIIAPMREVIESLEKQGPYLLPLHAHLYRDRGKKSRNVLSFGEVLDAAGISHDYTFHSWRHTAATRLAESGATKETRKLLLGHTTDENAERYDHADHLDELRKAVAAASSSASKSPTIPPQ